MSIYFKYTTKKHAEGMVKNGSFRIGTLYDYRKIENHGQEIGDREEGQKYLYIGGDAITENHPSFSNYTKQALGNIKMIDPQIIKNNLIINSPDLYIFATSLVLSRKIMRRMNKDYDSCVKITDGGAFFAALTLCFKRKGKIAGPFFGSCIYMKRQYYYKNDNEYEAALIKDSVHSYQKEFRTIWLPNNISNIAPQKITCKSASKYCEIVPEKEFPH